MVRRALRSGGSAVCGVDEAQISELHRPGLFDGTLRRTLAVVPASFIPRASRLPM
jgi:hypothetical protein